MYYDSGRLSLLERQQTALSDAPNMPGSVSWRNCAPRIVVEARFRDLGTGDFNTDAETDPYDELTGHGLQFDI